MKSLEKRFFTTTCLNHDQHFKLIITGGGTAGSSMAHNFVGKLNKDEIAVIEPNDTHYYQPLWTLVGAGIKPVSDSKMPMINALPRNITWIQDHVSEFNINKNTVILKSGAKLTYEYLVVALGIQLKYDLIPGAVDALKNDFRVVSNYSVNCVQKTFNGFQSFSEGKAIFTFPNTPVKCAGAPQKIMYLFDDYLRNKKDRSKAEIEYFTVLPTVFGIKKYSNKLTEICKNRDLKVNTRSHLIEVDSISRMAKFENLDTKKTTSLKYDFLHITPPMAGYDVIKHSELSDEIGFVAVNKETLQHIKYPNIFALGDCANLPTSKTAAGIASQQNVVYNNLKSLMNKKSPDVFKYNGYASCPFMTSYKKGILAEFGYNGEILETFPIDQAEERKFVKDLNCFIFPSLYWHGLIRGRWNGPGFLRKLRGT